MRPRLLDLFCGAGGSGMGYYNSGFDVTGVDIAPQPRYPFRFIQTDAVMYLAEHGKEYDVIHASPPCQGYSRLRHLPWLRDKEYPLLIEPVRMLLQDLGKPWVIENVEDSNLDGLLLCGLMFGLPVYRHRLFETSYFFLQPPHPKHEGVIGHGRRLNDRKKGTLNNGSAKGAWGHQRIITVAGNQFHSADGARALGINWMLKPELAQAIPPVYTEWLGRQILERMQHGNS